MGDLLFTLNAVMPIIAMVAIGYALKKLNILSVTVAKEINKLVFNVLLPIMLFMNVYEIDSIGSISMGYIVYTAVMVLLLFALSMLSVGFVTKDRRKKGPLVQASFRSNYALIGIPLATSVFGSEGGSLATLMSAFTIPLYNVLAVISLSVFSESDLEGKKGGGIKKILLGIVKNPLIDGIAVGAVALLIRMLLIKTGIEWRLTDVTWLYKVLAQLSSAATPLALIVLGATFEFSAIKGMKKEIAFGVITRIVAAPVLALSIALLLGCFSGAEFAVFVSVFGTSVAVSSVPMAQQMNADHELAGQLVVWTTILSAFTLFAFIYVFRTIGIF